MKLQAPLAALVRFSKGALETNVYKNTQLGSVAEVELTFLWWWYIPFNIKVQHAPLAVNT